MPAYYTYLISSLPILTFGAKPPFSFEDFIQKCKSLIPDEKVEAIRRISSQDVFSLKETGSEISRKSPSAITLSDFRSGTGKYEILSGTMKKWKDFDIALRNELVRVRAARKKVDPLKYLRQDGYSQPQIVHIASVSLRNPLIFEAEKALDLERWRLLDEQSFGRYFDFDALVIYALKLLILERWLKIGVADKERIMQETLIH